LNNSFDGDPVLILFCALGTGPIERIERDRTAEDRPATYSLKNHR
jgi:hypothetical protein